MLRTYCIASLTVLGFASSSAFPSYAALETNGALPEMAALSLAEQSDGSAPTCIPPEPQYLSTFMRDLDGSIVGIRYDIVEYVC